MGICGEAFKAMPSQMVTVWADTDRHRETERERKREGEKKTPKREKNE